MCESMGISVSVYTLWCVRNVLIQSSYKLHGYSERVCV